ncbi:MAG: hypothetical protein Q9219_005117 [cf. Caloplaca sp. 3 TL-2023]
MIVQLFQSKDSVGHISPPQVPAPTADYLDRMDTNSSTSTLSSVTDIEKGLFPEARSKRDRWEKTFGSVFTKISRLSNVSPEPGKTPRRRLTNGVKLIASRWGLPSPSTQQDLTSWPTDFSRDVQPIPCHSHNDYWRRVPLYDAIAAGCTGVEADVWYDPSAREDLLVGHTRKSLTAARTLKSLYIDPLLTILHNQNPPSNFSIPVANDTSNVGPSKNITGVFDTSPSTSLTLLIDLKTDPLTTFPIFLSALQPLLKAGYLTTWSPTTGLIPGPITAVATGNTNFTANILSPANTSPVRTIFFDAPLPALSTLNPTEIDMQYSTNNSYYASVSFAREIGSTFLGRLSTEQVWKIRRQIEGAKERGLVSRYWDTPASPMGVKEEVWKVLQWEGVGRVSVDDLMGFKVWGGLYRALERLVS